ncbi:MAG TPA: DUF5329 family protein [Burkholderiaceae bacterium]|nr:DUF5329 family protein [Burkholderiaceae bacterium]
MTSRRAAVVAVFAVPFTALRAAAAGLGAAESARIERLLKYVESQPQCKFIRNGEAYSAADVARFLRAKLARMGGQVDTATQFIDQIASRSSTSGQPYLIRCADGVSRPSAQVLAEELRRIDAQP